MTISTTTTVPTNTTDPATPNATPIVVAKHLVDLNILAPNADGTFKDWRKCRECTALIKNNQPPIHGLCGQRRIVSKIVNSPKKIVMLEAECGAGKSVIGVAAARTLNAPSIVLIQTLNLQEQYMRDFADSEYCGAKMMAGRAHSICNKTNKRADRAPCTIGARCGLVGLWDPNSGYPLTIPECNYFARKAEAKLAHISIQNYAYWLAETSNYRSSFGKADVIICDEGHELDQILMAAGTIQIDRADCRMLALDMPKTTLTPEQLHKWAHDINPTLTHRERTLRAQAVNLGLVLSDKDNDDDYEYRQNDDEDGSGGNEGDEIEYTAEEMIERVIDQLKCIQRLQSAVEQLNAITVESLADDFVFDLDARSFYIKPIFGKYGFQRILAAATKKVIIMSAFLAPRMLCKALGLDEADVEIIDAGRVFDRTDSPIYYTPVVKIKYDLTDRKREFMVHVVDAFIQAYSTRKGLVHVNSNQLRDFFLNKSRLRTKYIAYDNKNSASAGGWQTRFTDKDTALRTFVEKQQPCVLIGQSISTGIDLPYTVGFQVITKLAFPPITDPAIKKRMEVDKFFYPFLTLCQLVQATGRIKRAPDDGGPTFILDEQFGWFFARYRDHFPIWFLKSLVFHGWLDFPHIADDLRREARATGIASFGGKSH